MNSTKTGRTIACPSLWKGFILYGNIFLIFEKIYPVSGAECQQTKYYHLTSSSSSVVTQIPWKKATAWTGISTLGSCAYQAFTEHLAQGILYNSITGLCAPLLLDSGMAVAHNLANEEGKLYLGLRCPESFTVFDYSTSIVCLHHSTSQLTYDDATKACNDMGGHLATVKTMEVMQKLLDSWPQVNLWIGLDDQDLEGTYVYQKDGSVMTNVELMTLFSSGEPNNYGGTQHCVMLHVDEALIDYHCYLPFESLCEIVIFE